MKYKKEIVLAYFEECGLPIPETEYRFHAARKWRFDFAWPHLGQYLFTGLPLALEVQGGLFINGGHNRGAAMRKEHEKRNEAAALKWLILYVEPKDLCTMDTVNLIKRCLGINGKDGVL